MNSSAVLRSLIASVAMGFVQVHAAPGQPGKLPVAVPPIFVKAVRAADNLTFSGERTVEFMQGANRKVHSEYVLHQGLNSRVWFPPGSPFGRQVIVEKATERLHYFPGRNEIEVQPPQREEALIRLRNWVLKPGKAIRLGVAGEARVAGRPTQIGVITDPKGNVRQRLWIDRETGMILKRELLDNVGARVGMFEFTQIDYHPVIHPSDFAINVRGAVRVTPEDKLRRLVARNNMLEMALPSQTGFLLEAVNMVRPAGIVALHQSYIGARGKLSLFQVAGLVDLQSFGQNRARDIGFYSWQVNGHSFALVGNYPMTTLRTLAQSVGPFRNAP